MAMLKSLLAFLVLAFAFFLCFISTSTGSYLYFQFVQQWPPTTCRISNKPSNQHRPLQRFTIHGLWPSNYSNPKKPSNCSGSQFKGLSPQLRSKLTISWPNVESGNDTKFWEYEWNKHGTCSKENLNQMQYFERSFAMWMAYNITNILKNASIVPSATQTWKYSDIVSPIKAVTQTTPFIRCKRDRAQPKSHPAQPKSQPKWLLHEVVLCFDYDALKQIDCNQTECPNHVDIWFPQ